MPSPLIAHRHAKDIVAWHSLGSISAGEFIADVLRVKAYLTETDYVLNVCTQRYHFAVGLAAAILAGKITLLPATHTPEMIRQLKQLGNVRCLSDHDTTIELPKISYPVRALDKAIDPIWPAPQIPADQVIVWIYTSGSTGAPLPHTKTWGKLGCVDN